MRDAHKQLEQADLEFETGNHSKAHAFYTKAADSYREIEAQYGRGDIDLSVVRFRLNYCNEMLRRAAAADVPVDTHAAESGSAERNQPLGEPLERGDTGSNAPAQTPDTPGETGSAAPPVYTKLTEFTGMIHALRAKGEHEKALQLLQKSVNAEPDHTSLRLMLALVFIERFDYDDALITLSDLPEPDRELEAVFLLRAAAQYGAGQPFEALLSIDQALKLYPRSHRAYLNLAWLRYRMNPQLNRRESEAFYRFAVRLGAHRDARLEKLLGMEVE